LEARARLVADALVTAKACGGRGLVNRRVDSAYCTHDVVAAPCRGGARFSITARMIALCWKAISGVPDSEWILILCPRGAPVLAVGTLRLTMAVGRHKPHAVTAYQETSGRFRWSVEVRPARSYAPRAYDAVRVDHAAFAAVRVNAGMDAARREAHTPDALPDPRIGGLFVILHVMKCSARSRPPGEQPSRWCPGAGQAGGPLPSAAALSSLSGGHGRTSLATLEQAWRRDAPRQEAQESVRPKRVRTSDSR
jgi:hypothetical protein